MENFMNIPEIIPITESNIIEEYRRNHDVKHVAKVFSISTKEVRSILKQAGIATKIDKRRTSNALDEIGMSEKDFCHDVSK